MDYQEFLFPEIEKEIYSQKEKEFQTLKAKLRKENKYTKDEDLFQEAQEHWEKNRDLKSWHIMYKQIQKACFNCINQKLCRKIPNEEIENYSHDVTMNILNNIMAKKLRGEFWKIAKLSAFVHLPCMAIYEPQKNFEDNVLDESSFTFFQDGQEKTKETENSYFKNGIYHI